MPDGYSDGAISTRQPRKTFELVTLALDNPYWEGSPFGVALFDAALGAIETTELAFDNIGNELVLGRKMVMIPEAMLRRDEATGRMMLPQEERLQFYVALKDATVYADGRPMITEYNPCLLYTSVTEKTMRNRIKEHGGFWIDGASVGRKAQA